jgi:hypothetical protein
MGMASRASLWGTAICCWAASVLAADPASSTTGTTPAPASSIAPPEKVSIGIYLTALFDLDPASQSFDADFILWTDRPATGANQENPLDNIVFPGSRQVQVLFQSTRVVDGVQWCLRRYHARFFYDWNLGNFPFDRHRILLAMRDHSNDGRRITYVPDIKNSGVSDNIDLPGWRVEDFNIETTEVEYRTTFGRPGASEHYSSPWVKTTVVLHRNASSVFIKLMTGAYIAFGAAMLACFMKLDHPPVFSGRMVLLISCLFATIVNNRATDSAMGREEIFTLPDLLHVLIYISIFAAMVVTLRARVLCERGQLVMATHMERRVTLGIVALFAVANVILIWRAAIMSIHTK